MPGARYVSWLVVEIEGSALGDRLTTDQMERLFDTLTDDALTCKRVTLTFNEPQFTDTARFQFTRQVDEEPGELPTQHQARTKPETMEGLAEEFGEDVVEEWVTGGVVPTRCGEGCQVEPDGICPHGYRSLLINAGAI